MTVGRFDQQVVPFPKSTLDGASHVLYVHQHEWKIKVGRCMRQPQRKYLLPTVEPDIVNLK